MFSAFFSPLQRFYKFILKRLIGNLLENELDLHQLEVQLGAGVVELSNLRLNVKVLNDAVLDLPITVTEATVRAIRLTIPWRNLLNEHCKLLVEGLDITVVPRCQVPKPSTATSADILSQSIAELNIDEDEFKKNVLLHRKLEKLQEGDLATSHLSDAYKGDKDKADSGTVSTDEGLQVVAGFLERVVSQTELEVKDFAVHIENTDKHTCTTLSIHLPWLSYKGASEDGGRDEQKNDDRPSFGPVFEYYKAIRFHGFHITLSHQPVSCAPEPVTIIHGDTAQDCILYLKVIMAAQAGSGPRVILNGFVRSLRMLVAPRHLTWLSCIFESIGVSARQMALEAHFKQIVSSPGSISDSVTTASTMSSISSSHLQDKSASIDIGEYKDDAISIGLYDFDQPSKQPQAKPPRADTNGPTPESTVQLWHLKFHFSQGSITLQQSDEAVWPHDWWMEPVTVEDDPDFSNQSDVDPLIARLEGDHLTFLLHRIAIVSQQSSLDSVFDLQVGHAQLFEYLAQRVQLYKRYTWSDLSRDIRQQIEVTQTKFVRRSLMRFRSTRSHQAEKTTRSGDEFVPDYLGAFMSSADQVLKPHFHLTSQTSQSFSDASKPHTSTTLNFEPVEFDIDIRFSDRLQNLVNAFSAGPVQVSAPPTGTEAVVAVTEPLAEANIASKPPTDPAVDVITATALPEDRSPSSIDVYASHIAFSLTFPESKIKSKRKRNLSSHSPFYYVADSRGQIRSEKVVVTLRDLKASTHDDGSCDDTEWDLRFTEIKAYLNRRDQATPEDPFLTAFPCYCDEEIIYPSIHVLTRGTRQPLSRASSAEDPLNDKFFRSLPSFRVWEPNELDTKEDAHASPSREDFEQSCIVGSHHVLTWLLPSASIFLHKSDYDLIMFLYDLALQTNLDEFVADPTMPLDESNPSGANEEAFHMPFTLDDEDEVKAEDVVPDSQVSPAINWSDDSDADSDTGDEQDQFKSVVESPVLDDGDSQRAAEFSEMLSSSDLLASSVHGVNDDNGFRSHSDTASESNSLTDPSDPGVLSQELSTIRVSDLSERGIDLTQSMMFTLDRQRPQSISPNEPLAESSGLGLAESKTGDTLDASQHHHESSYSVTEESDAENPSDDESELFHTIVLDPKLQDFVKRSKIMLPDEDNSSDHQEKSKNTNPSQAAAKGPLKTDPALPSPPVSSGYKHFMSVRIFIIEGSVCLTEDSTCVSARHQSFQADLNSVDLLQVVLFNNKPKTYLSLGCDDITAREFSSPVHQRDKLYAHRSIPFLFKTLWTDERARLGRANQPRSARECLSYTPNIEHHVMRVSVVIDQNLEENTRHVLAVLNLRALTLQYIPESSWTTKITEFFSSPVSPDADSQGVRSNTPSVSSSVKDSTSVGQSLADLDATAVDGDTEYPEDIVKLFINAFNCVVDYNPCTVPSRCALVFDSIRISTNIVQSSPVFILKIEIRDGAGFLLDVSDPLSFTVAPAVPVHPSLARVTSCSIGLRTPDTPFLRNIDRENVLEHLEELGFARLATLDYMQILVKTLPQAIQLPSGEESVVSVSRTEITNGALGVFTCSDSFQTFIELVDCFINAPTSTGEELGVVEAAPAPRHPSTSAYTPRQDTEELKMASRTVLSEAPTAVEPSQTSEDVQYALEHAIHNPIQARPSEQPFSSEQEEKAPNIPVIDNYSDYSQPAPLRRHHRPPEQTAGWYAADAAVDPWNKADQQQRSKHVAAPTIIEDHVKMPDLEDLETENAVVEEELKDPFLRYPVPVSELVFSQVNINWRIFGGSDWGTLETAPQTRVATPSPDRKTETIITPRNYSAPTGRDPLPVAHMLTEDLQANEEGSLRIISDYGDVGHHHYERAPQDGPRELQGLPLAAAPPSSTGPSLMSSVSSMAIPVATKVRRQEFRGLDAYVQDSSDLSTLEDHKAPYGANSPKHRITKQRQRGTRLTDSVVEFQFQGATIRSQSFSEEEQLASRLTISVRDIEIVDLLDASPFKKFLCYYRPSGWRGRDKNTYMLRMALDTVNPLHESTSKPAAGLPTENRLRMEFLPLRINADQDTIEFLVTFFQGPSPPSSADAKGTGEEPPSQDLRMSVSVAGVPSASPPPASEEMQSPAEEEELSYFQHFETKGLRICIDYAPKRVNFKSLRDGDYSQLVHLFPLEEMEIDLKSLRLSGHHGWGDLFSAIAMSWATDIGQRQAHKYLSGVQPIRSFVNVGAGVADLVLLPIQQYKTDGRVGRGLRKGTSAFVRSVAMETMRVGAKIAVGAQALLETVDDTLGGTHRVPTNQVTAAQRPTAIARGKTASKQAFHKMSDPPKNLGDGLMQAYQALSRGLQTAAHNVVVVPREEYMRAGTVASVKSVVRAVPGAVLRPMIGAAEALTRALLAVQVHVDPRSRLELDDKYKAQKK